MARNPKMGYWNSFHNEPILVHAPREDKPVRLPNLYPLVAVLFDNFGGSPCSRGGPSISLPLTPWFRNSGHEYYDGIPLARVKNVPQVITISSNQTAHPLANLYPRG